MKIQTLFYLLFFSSVFLNGLDLSSGGVLSKSQASIDVHHYDIDLRVDPYKRFISGKVKIKFTLLEATSVFEFDLYQSFTISGVLINGMNLDFEHKNHTIFIPNPDIDLFDTHQLVIKYGGSPPVAKRPPWDGGFTWETSESGHPWVGVSCQGNGAHVWYPCKEHPSDKADSADIKITAPDPIKAVANGLLVSKKQKDLWTTWHWKTQYPISTYNINFTLGDFNVVEKTGYILNKPLKIVYYVLPEAEKGAVELLNLTEEYLNFYANSFGQYPWIKEKFGLVHTPYWGMEHQTINAYGNAYKKTKLGYDFILFHEMGHEWWGNYLSVADWSDFWIHEGFDTYAEAMFVEEKFGWDMAIQFVDERYKKNIKNDYPVVMDKNGTTKNPAGNDVYYKGAHVLHMLRYLIGDEVFRSSLKEYISMPKELEKNQTSTKEFISLIEENTGLDLQWFFDVYLYQGELPILNVKEKFLKEKLLIDFWWENKGFVMPIEITYNGHGGKTTRKLVLNNKPHRVAINKKEKYELDPDHWLLFDINRDFK